MANSMHICRWSNVIDSLNVENADPTVKYDPSIMPHGCTPIEYRRPVEGDWYIGCGGYPKQSRGGSETKVPRMIVTVPESAG